MSLSSASPPRPRQSAMYPTVPFWLLFRLNANCHSHSTAMALGLSVSGAGMGGSQPVYRIEEPPERADRLPPTARGASRASNEVKSWCRGGDVVKLGTWSPLV